MTNHKKKEPTKLEKEINFQFNQIYSVLKDFDNRITALSRAKIEPEAMAHFLLEDTENLIYREKLNQAIDAEIAKKKEAQKVTVSPETQKTLDAMPKLEDV